MDQPLIQSRKADHLEISRTKPVQFDSVSTGFERYVFEHQALPELALSEIDTHTTFFGKALSAPIIISGMTGGTDLAGRINRHIASAVQELGLGMGVGSQRIIFKQPETLESFQVRDRAPDILLIGNLGAVQFNYGFGAAEARQIVEWIGADALALHLNVLQEAIQPEGDTNFRGLYEKIADVCQALPFPVLAKEVGCGISASVARQLAASHISGIDVSGAGGTSWALIESYRAADPIQRAVGQTFANWGIPTAESLIQCRQALPTMPLIASGGIRTGIDIAKAIALGADLVSVALPALEPAAQSEEGIRDRLRQLMLELRVSMLCIGAGNLQALRSTPYLHKRS